MRKNVLLSLGMMTVLVGASLLRPGGVAADPAVSSINPVLAFDASGAAPTRGAPWAPPSL
jgi:hypothetical protein